MDDAIRDCFIVRDGNGQALVYIYLEEEPGRRAAWLFSNSSKREIAVGSAIPRRKACRCAVLPVDLSRSSEGII